ncbi:ribosome maturation factor RimM [Macromonas nakdongensis]|uniref:ribosome maturation factor RimM n=1 Tax=Macromonas nakdongensis TaxID=1843082 RepID=UPI000C33C0A4|nr:ribosome maturation factor RimM [Macromonas nakdongensis]
MAAVPGLTPTTLPADAVEVGRVQEAWGIKGWVRLHPHSASADVLLGARHWYLCPPEGRYARGFDAFTGVVGLEVEEVKPHADGIVARLAAVADRNAAEALKSARIFVSRADFPDTGNADEYYWVDLIGLQVLNREGVELGTVRDLLPTGPHSVLCLEQTEGDKTVERMIPFVSVYVDRVDLPGRRITVDWQPDY